ncbi:PrpF protein-domain-containing protein [Dactylonectria estremocensis]|uniref:PrpF protein-domain-containing protein n=1 Tax=Dactylonectria estremocensis TaxID=1079267 RepID=A0A9P9FEH6_9HYPO|nr:PrpF protein-domain-containing protein [Dactylonectria estremocensis]
MTPVGSPNLVHFTRPIFTSKRTVSFIGDNVVIGSGRPHLEFMKMAPKLPPSLTGKTPHHLLQRLVKTTPASVSPLRQTSTSTARIMNSPQQYSSRHYSSQSRSFPALFARGGTSNGLVIDRRDLPPQEQWLAILPAAMGSPDSYGRQLDGMGSGISSTSKIVILGPPSRPDVDVDFTFVQVAIREAELDMAGNCGNMSSLVGPAAFDRGMVADPAVETDEDGSRWATVRFLNTNTNKVMMSRFKVAGDPLRYSHEGDYVMDGVPGAGSKITMSFMNPAGAKTGKALPTGNPVDILELSNGSTVQASLVDVGNPGVFISTESLGLANHMALTPPMVEADEALKTRLEEIRRAGATKMGLDPQVQSVPKIVLLFPSSGSPEVDIRCLALSMGQAHKAVPLTLALCLGASSQLPGTIAADLVMAKSKGTVTIGHPSGTVDIGTTIRDGKIELAQLLRTARILMKGDVYY